MISILFNTFVSTKYKPYEISESDFFVDNSITVVF